MKCKTSEPAKQNFNIRMLSLPLFPQLLPIERAARKQKKRQKVAAQESEDEDDDDNDDEDEEEEEDEKMDDEEEEEEEDTVQANIDYIDGFKLPSAKEREKEGES